MAVLEIQVQLEALLAVVEVIAVLLPGAEVRHRGLLQEAVVDREDINP
jgi:hypothetical protein